MRRTSILPSMLLATLVLLVGYAGCNGEPPTDNGNTNGNTNANLNANENVNDNDNGSAPECVTNADCDDSDGCTTDSCIDGECFSDANGVDNGLFCDGQESCDPATGVVSSSGDPCAEAANPICDEENIRCVQCLSDDDCTGCEFCIENTCVAQEFMVDAGADQLVGTSSTVNLTCTSNTESTSLSWEQNAGDSTQINLIDNGDGTATFTAPSAFWVTLNFTCSSTFDLNQDGDVEDQCEILTDSVQVSTEQGCICLICDNKLFNLTDNDSFDANLPSTAGAEGDADQPGGLQALSTANIPGVQATDILITFDCVSGPGGASDCSSVSFDVKSIQNGSGAVGQYTIATQSGSFPKITRSGGTSTSSTLVPPGDWTFKATATFDGDQLGTDDCIYTILPEMKILTRDTDGASFIGALAFNGGFGTDDFPASLIPDDGITSLQGLVLKRGSTTNYVMAAGATMDAMYSVLAVDDGTVNFFTQDISGSSLGLDSALNSVFVTADSANLQDITAMVVAPADLGTYNVRASWDSKSGKMADTVATPTDLMIHMQPDLGSSINLTTQVGAANSLSAATFKWHGGTSSTDTDMDGQLICMSDVNGDGVPEAIVITNSATDVTEETLIYLTPNPTDDLVDNMGMNTGEDIDFDDANFFTTVDMDLDGTLENAADNEALCLACGDLDGDLHPDLVVSVNEEDGGDADENLGAVHVMYHLESTATTDTVVYGEDPYDEDGSDVAVGELTRTTDGDDETDGGGDGWLFGYSCGIGNVEGGTSSDNELIVGAPAEENDGNNDSAGADRTGQVYILSRGLNDRIPTTNIADSTATSGIVTSTIVGSAQQDWMGAGLAIGDVDGDGMDDMVIGAPGFNGDTGRVFVFLGTTGNLPSTPSPDTAYTGGAADGFGRRVVLGQFNGTGNLDIAASGCDNAGLTPDCPGIIHVIFDTPTSATIANIAAGGVTTFSGTGAENWGWRMGAGDIDGDGIDDLLWTGLGDDTAVNEEIFLWNGIASPTATDNPDTTFTGTGGAGVANLPIDGGGFQENADPFDEDGAVNQPGGICDILDINLDGYPDVVVSENAGDGFFFVAGRDGD